MVENMMVERNLGQSNYERKPRKNTRIKEASEGGGREGWEGEREGGSKEVRREERKGRNEKKEGGRNEGREEVRKEGEESKFF